MNHALLKDKLFDVCIIDEAGQVRLLGPGRGEGGLTLLLGQHELQADFRHPNGVVS